MHDVEDTRGLLAAIAKALRPDGRLVVVNWRALPREATTVAGEPQGPPTDLRLSPEEAETIVLDGSEFAPRDRVDLPPYRYGLVFER